ncbi:MAG TPA: NAD(P)H-dependent oxidoreductase subunit E [Spirochaetota bacterium]|nr:NAD(P)H-dependent oxidoreductase subunit E [Spirochaetota bacterium]
MHEIKKSNIIDKILARYDKTKKSELSKILLDIQNEFGYLNEEIIKKTANYLGISSTEIYGFASFYSMYNLEKPGKYIIKICKGTACHVKGSSRLIKEIEGYLGIKEGETTKDGLIKLEVASCLGVCALAPVVIINEKTYTRVNAKIVKSLIDEIRASHKDGEKDE